MFFELKKILVTPAVAAIVLAASGSIVNAGEVSGGGRINRGGNCATSDGRYAIGIGAAQSVPGTDEIGLEIFDFKTFNETIVNVSNTNPMIGLDQKGHLFSMTLPDETGYARLSMVTPTGWKLTDDHVKCIYSDFNDPAIPVSPNLWDCKSPDGEYTLNIFADGPDRSYAMLWHLNRGRNEPIWSGHLSNEAPYIDVATKGSQFMLAGDPATQMSLSLRILDGSGDNGCLSLGEVWCAKLGSYTLDGLTCKKGL